MEPSRILYVNAVSHKKVEVIDGKHSRVDNYIMMDLP